MKVSMAATAVCLLGLGCAQQVAPTGPETAAPVIGSFVATPLTIAAGGSSTLAWSATGATSLSIDHGIGDVTGKTSTSISPSVTTTYMLTATNGAGSVTATATVTIALPGAPIISAFSAAPLKVAAGQSTTLSWSISGQGPISLSIDQGVGTVIGTSKSVVPAAVSTTYTLTATNAAGSTTAAATVAVTPSIASFTATPTSIAAGQSSTLDWVVSGPGTITLAIDSGVGTVTGSSKNVSPATTATYTLTASNAAGAVTATATVNVAGAGSPVINSFTASPSAVALGDPMPSATLAWNVTGATSLAIDNGIGTVSGAAGTKSIAPSASTTYRLTATNANGSSTATATVDAVVITAFSATPSPVAAGGAVTLSWTAAGATGLTIDNGVGSVAGSSTVVHPTSSTTYRLTASNGAASFVSAATVTVNPSAPPPVIHSFTADALSVPAGIGSTLRWAVANASTLSIDNSIGVVTGSSQPVAPPATTTYTLTASNATGSVTASVTVVVVTAPVLSPGSPGGTPAVTFTLDSGHGVHPISPWIYCYNTDSPSTAPSGTTCLRHGGNRWTAFNWETNASNAGADFFYENDDFLTSSTAPGAAVTGKIAAERAAGMGSLVTVPMQGWVSADENAGVNGSAILGAPLYSRFVQTVPRKGSALQASPDKTDRFVYQDEYVHFLDGQFPGAFGDPAAPILLSLDNEPEDWFSPTHPEVQRTLVTYAQVLRQSIDLATAIKEVAPHAVTIGPVAAGFGGFFNLNQNGSPAPDAASYTDGWFFDTYLKQLRLASEGQGRRLLDSLDGHWYSEAQGTDHTGTPQRVIFGTWSGCTTCNDPGVRAARVQAPRTLWQASYGFSSADPTAGENSWIAQFFSPVALIRTLQSKIATQFPGTGVSFSEYNHGGGDDISGAVSEADVLGIFGREGVFEASLWPLLDDNRFFHAAYRAYRNYDGAGGAFGNTSIQAVSSDDSRASVYASVDAGHPERVVVVAVNKTTSALAIQLKLTHPQSLGTAHVWQVTSASPYLAPAVIPQQLADIGIAATNAFNASLPGYSVTTFVLVP